MVCCLVEKSLHYGGSRSGLYIHTLQRCSNSIDRNNKKNLWAKREWEPNLITTYSVYLLNQMLCFYFLYNIFANWHSNRLCSTSATIFFFVFVALVKVIVLRCNKLSGTVHLNSPRSKFYKNHLFFLWIMSIYIK